MKKFFYFSLTLFIIIIVSTINIFLKINSDINHIIGINIIFILHLLIALLCIFSTNRIFKMFDFKTSKNFRKNIKNSFANSFFVESIISIISACIIYGFLRNILESFHLKNGIINYCVFASKIWFISSPFIGLEITVFKYFFTIEYFQKPSEILIKKLIIFFIISLLFYNTRKINCFIYAKPICDIIFLIYYSKICFDITLNKT